MMNEHYRVLGLEPNASFEEVKKQYNQLVKKYHPDINPDGKEMFEKIYKAYTTIKSSPHKQSQTSYQSSLDIDIEKIFKNDTYRYNASKKKNTTKKATIDVSATLQEYVEGNFEKIIVLDTGFQKKYTFGKGIVPYKTTQTDKIKIDNIEYVIHFRFILDDTNVKYDQGTARFVKYVHMSASEFLTSNVLHINWNTDTYEVNISKISTDQLLKLKGKGFYNSSKSSYEDLYIKIIVYKD